MLALQSTAQVDYQKNMESLISPKGVKEMYSMEHIWLVIYNTKKPIY